MINASDLKSFLTTAKVLHLTKAAKELGMSQPALSHCIKRLEAELGDEVFLRRKDGLILTKTGQYLFNKGQKIIDDLVSISTYVETGKEEKKSLSIGMHASVGAYTLPAILKEVEGFDLNLNFGLSREVTSWVQEGKIDCAIAINPYPHSSLIISPLGDDEFQLWCRKKDFDQNYLFFDPQLHQTHFILRQLEKKGMKFTHQVEISNLELIAKLVYEGSGVGILPSRVIKNFYPRETQLYSKDIRPFIDRICFVYLMENKHNLHLKEFKNQVKVLFEN
jgi:DNA-binding transcriptional LysR family regulator